MNIFQVLSQGKSRLHEPSMSAMLGYLLDSHRDHGLGDAFVRVFLQGTSSKLFQNALALDFIESEVSLEEPYQLNGSRRDVDIQVTLLDENRKESHRIIIENKIKTSAANPKQLLDYYNAVLQDDPDIKNLIMVFLTPESEASPLKKEFANLNSLKEENGHRKEWLFWDSASTGSVVSMVREVLNMEAQGKINPINDYMRHTLKAFVRHSSTVVQAKWVKSMRTGEDIGEIVDEAIIQLENGVIYRVVRRDSSQIQVFNSETGDKEVARQVLSKFIDENKLAIRHTELNTRAIGRQFFDWRNSNRSSN